jgi:hypothetical protein
VKRVVKRIGSEDERGRIALHLEQIVSDDQPELLPLRRWAHERLCADPLQPVIWVEQTAIEQIADLWGIQPAELIDRLTRLTASTCSIVEPGFIEGT